MKWSGVRGRKRMRERERVREGRKERKTGSVCVSVHV